ncbi:EAL domain-containing protein [Qipengyuania sp. JC766]|uniref:putative bifunctional diguanylate cyclase/phosphodiesterase n=1 Tax=Qipengyuania sp. JC766 TaxID=3232139 RepID=UPI00345740FA
MALGIGIASVLMFVGTGSAVIPEIANSWVTGTNGPNFVLINALLLNIALLIFGMRRYRDLLREVETRRQAESRAKELAETDPLTGCLNRRTLIPAIDGKLAEGNPLAILVCDLDKFKQINDLYGHKAGDFILGRAAERIRCCLPEGALLARIGGDEFVVVLPCDPNAAQATDRIVDRIIEATRREYDFEGQILRVTTSIGIAECREMPTDTDASTLMHRADIAMYHAKQSGKNRSCTFEHSMEQELLARGKLENGIRAGIECGEFVPYYEQQIDLETGRLVGFEMLARWKSPDMGLVNPTVFIPIAEEINVISEISEQLIAQALQDAMEWDPSLSLSVNISPMQLRDPWFSHRLLKLLLQNRFPAQRLEIEITESCLVENLTQVRGLIDSLKNQGVRVSLDDFGAGYSSLNQLRTLPFDSLKIDRNFVCDLRDQDGDGRLIDAIVSIGRGLDIPIVAEGIECTEVLELLRQKGQMKGQGYLYGRPTDADTVRRQLREQGLLQTGIDVSDEEMPAAQPRQQAAS